MTEALSNSSKAIDRCRAEIGTCRVRALRLSTGDMADVAERLIRAGIELTEQAGVEFEGPVSVNGVGFANEAERKAAYYANDIVALKKIIGERGQIIKDMRRRKKEWKRRAVELGYKGDAIG